jgi:hypothetical protein
MARHETNGVVLEAATGIEYPSSDRPPGTGVALRLLLRPLVLGLMGLGLLPLMRSDGGAQRETNGEAPGVTSWAG